MVQELRLSFNCMGRGKKRQSVEEITVHTVESEEVAYLGKQQEGVSRRQLLQREIKRNKIWVYYWGELKFNDYTAMCFFIILCVCVALHHSFINLQPESAMSRKAVLCCSQL